MSDEPKNPNDCLHANLHLKRHDGSHTVCYDCRQPVLVTVATYASGEPIDKQFMEMYRKLGEEPGRCKHCARWLKMRGGPYCDATCAGLHALGQMTPKKEEPAPADDPLGPLTDEEKRIIAERRKGK